MSNQIKFMLLFIILVYLGIWQINRGIEKKNILTQIKTRSAQTPLNLAHLVEPSLRKDRFTHVIADGTLLEAYTFLLQNQTNNHQAGFRVLTPLKDNRLDKLVLIDRGWIPNNYSLDDFNNLKINAPVIGIINHIASGIVLKKDHVIDNPQWPIIIQSIDSDLISQQLQQPVFDFVITSKDFMPQLSLSPNKNFAYAGQWFSFAVLSAIYYFIMRRQRRKQ